jgi:hypothetical protein
MLKIPASFCLFFVSVSIPYSFFSGITLYFFVLGYSKSIPTDAAGEVPAFQ